MNLPERDLLRRPNTTGPRRAPRPSKGRRAPRASKGRRALTSSTRQVVTLAAALFLAGCLADDDGAGDEASSRTVLLATTTSVEDTGLLEALALAYHDGHPQDRLRVVAVGTGHALELARRGDADVLLVHDPAAESAFVAAGHGDRRRTIMHNDFVIVGPSDDPAGVRGAADPLDALRRIARARALFLSRGDSSGTHRKERDLWRASGLAPGGDWYLEAGVGQGDVLRMASERAAYALVDRGTYRFLDATLRLEVLHEDGPLLDNPYSVIVPTRAPNRAGARRFAQWLSGEAARAVIAAYAPAGEADPLFDVVR